MGSFFVYFYIQYLFFKSFFPFQFRYDSAEVGVGDGDDEDQKIEVPPVDVAKKVKKNNGNILFTSAR